MTTSTRPLYCLADSQLLFWTPAGENAPYMRSSLQPELDSDPKAAYLGASNNDDPGAYSIFEAAMDSIGIPQRAMVKSSFPDTDRDWLEQADLIVLAGGDPIAGWRTFERNGIVDIIRRRYTEGAVLIGVSAGAVQLGWAADAGAEKRVNGSHSNPAPIRDSELVEMLRLVTAIVGAHEEEHDWLPLRRLVRGHPSQVRGLGIPARGGFVCYPDQTIEPIRCPLQEIYFDSDADRWCENLLFPEQQHGGAET